MKGNRDAGNAGGRHTLSPPSHRSDSPNSSEAGESSDSEEFSHHAAPARPRDTLARYQPEHGEAPWTGTGRKISHGLEAELFQAGNSAVKSYGYARDYAAQRRDSEFAALQKLHDAVPDLVPEPHSKGEATTGDGRTRPALSMDYLPGESFAGRKLNTPELRRLQTPLDRLGAALKDKKVVWDNTPANVMMTPDGPRFIDFKDADHTPREDAAAFTETQLRMLARNQSSVDKIYGHGLSGTAFPAVRGAARAHPPAMASIDFTPPSLPAKPRGALPSSFAPKTEHLPSLAEPRRPQPASEPTETAQPEPLPSIHGNRVNLATRPKGRR